MGKLVFDQEYNMLTSDGDHYILDVIDAFQHGQVILGTVPRIEQWGLAPLLFVKVMASIIKFRRYVDGQVAQRIADERAGNGSDDIFRLLLNHRDKATGEHMDFKELSDEAVVLIIAGELPPPFSVSFFFLAILLLPGRSVRWWRSRQGADMEDSVQLAIRRRLLWLPAASTLLGTPNATARSRQRSEMPSPAQTTSGTGPR